MTNKKIEEKKNEQVKQIESGTFMDPGKSFSLTDIVDVGGQF